MGKPRIDRLMQPDVKNVVETMRDLRADFDASKQTRFKRFRTGMIPAGSHADYHYRTWYAYGRIMETARDMFRNHCLVAQGIRRLVSNILRGGFTLDVKTGDTGLNRELKARWDEWASEPDQCDFAGEQNWHGIEKLCLQHVLVDGDCLSLPTRQGAVQQVEAHRIRTPMSTTRNVVHGVLLDNLRRRLEYWITKEDVSAMSPVPLVSNIERYPARAYEELTDREERQVFHHYMPDRVSQTRGLTALVPVMDVAGMTDDLFFAQLVKAQMAACVTIFRELAPGSTIPPELGGSGDPIEKVGDDRPSGITRNIGNFQPGIEIFGFPGEKLQGFTPNVPNAEFFEHSKMLLSILSVNLDLPICVFLLDASETNFSGFRGALDQARQRFKEIQTWLIHSLHTPVYRWKVRQWAAEDSSLRKTIIEQAGKSPLKGGVDAFGHVWHAQEWPYIEPVNDAMGDVVQERNLLNSGRRLAARRGLDYPELMDEIVDDRGLVVIKAHAKAQHLNETLKLDPPLTWKDIALWPMPEGVSVTVGAVSATAGNKEDNERAPAGAGK